ncbi:hypothetical protein [Nocardia sp. NPDC051833]|uniref:hypothetical protein n=1 Tax=Nocardia sp. NPDC051833 TaxID=3155674 RepID=UPI00342D88A4
MAVALDHPRAQARPAGRAGRLTLAASRHEVQEAGREAVATVAGGLLLRGALGLVYSGFVGKRSLFTRWDLAVYSPFSLVVGALAAGVAVGDKESRADVIG